MTRERAEQLHTQVVSELAAFLTTNPVQEVYLALGSRYVNAVQNALPETVNVVDGADTIGRMQARLRAWLTADRPVQMQLQLSIEGNSPPRRRPSAPLCFASGANEAGEIRGFVSLGIPVGVSAAEIRRPALEEIRRLAGCKVPLFLDSGAYGELTSRAAIPPASGARAITRQEWKRRLDAYRVIGCWLRDQLFAVTPDRVGDQSASLTRMADHAAELRIVANTGASLLLPLHRGSRALPDYHAKAQDLLGVPLVPAFPMPKGRLTTHEILRTLEALQPARVHLLGFGPRSPRARELLRLLDLRDPAMRVSMDANFVAATVGRHRNGRAARPLTLAQDEIRARGFADTYGAVSDRAWGIHLDYTDIVGNPSEWMGARALRSVATDARLDAVQSARWLRDPDGFLQEPIHRLDPDGLAWWAHPLMSAAVDKAWHNYLQRRHTAPRKAEAIRRTFATHPAAGQFEAPSFLQPGTDSLATAA